MCDEATINGNVEKNGNEGGRSHFRFVPNGQKSGCKIREAAFNLTIEEEMIDPVTKNTIVINFTYFKITQITRSEQNGNENDRQ